MKSLITSIFFVSVFLLQPAQAELSLINSLEIDLVANTHVAGRYFTLGEIARIEHADPSMKERLNKLRIGRAPRVGQISTVSRDAILKPIERAYPGKIDTIVWHGATRLQISRIGEVYKKEAYLALAKQTLSTHLSQQFDDYEIKSVGTYKDVILPTSRTQLRTKVSQHAHVKKRMSVWIDVYNNDNHYRTIPVWFDVSVLVNVYTLNRDVDAGVSIHPSWISFEVKDIAMVIGDPINSSSDLDNKRLKSKMSAGSVLTEAMLETIPLVSKGQRVTVLAQVGAVSLQVEAEALQDGFLGDRVQLQRPGTDDKYVAIVQGQGFVTIQEGL